MKKLELGSTKEVFTQSVVYSTRSKIHLRIVLSPRSVSKLSRDGRSVMAPRNDFCFLRLVLQGCQSCFAFVSRARFHHQAALHIKFQFYFAQVRETPGVVCFWLDVSCNTDSDCNRCKESSYGCHVIEDIFTMGTKKVCTPTQDGDEY